VTKEEWDRLRKPVYKHAAWVCEICGGRGESHPVECHEIWQYDDVQRVQRLAGLIALCPACHQVKHIGLAQVMGRGIEARKHLEEVNGWAADQVTTYIRIAFAVWELRSQMEWHLDLNWLSTQGVSHVDKQQELIRKGLNNGGNSMAESAEQLHAEDKPSQVTDVYWIHATRKKGQYPAGTQRCGKWLIFVPVERIDQVWAAIKEATEEGKLGSSSKVATAKPNSNARNLNQHVICVYTYDWVDVEDVRRVRHELRNLGIVDKLPYKTDEDTLAGKYRVTGHTRISKYYE